MTNRSSPRASFVVLLMAIPSGAGMLACGSSPTDGSGETSAPAVAAPTPTAIDLTKPLSGASIALGLLGDPTLSGQSTFTAAEAKEHALNRDIVAQIDADAPGMLEAYAADLHSTDAGRVAAALAGIEALLASAAASSALDARIAADPVFATVAPRDYGHLSILGLVGADAGGLVTDGGMLVCDTQHAPNLGRVNGRYGDDRTGPIGAAQDLLDLPGTDMTSLGLRAAVLAAINVHNLRPDAESRLGAYAANVGYRPGTVGAAVHNAIGTIYLTLGNYGQEKIGRVFNDAQARALYNLPVSSCASVLIATIEHNYWQNCKDEDPSSAGGQLGSAFNPWSRDLLQKNVFNH